MTGECIDYFLCAETPEEIMLALAVAGVVPYSAPPEEEGIRVDFAAIDSRDTDGCRAVIRVHEPLPDEAVDALPISIDEPLIVWADEKETPDYEPEQ